MANILRIPNGAMRARKNWLMKKHPRGERKELPLRRTFFPALGAGESPQPDLVAEFLLRAVLLALKLRRGAMA